MGTTIAADAPLPPEPDSNSNLEPNPVSEPGSASGPVPEQAPKQPDPIPDTRLYVPDYQEWEIHIKRNSERYFCFSKHPGEDWFHLLLAGEIYVARQHEMYCLRCALRLGFLTDDRLFWQHRVPKGRSKVL